MTRSSSDRNIPSLDRATLERLALHYVGRYATTQAKLAVFLRRKLRERGWDGEGDAPIEAIVAGFVDRGYIDDQAFGEARTAALLRRGMGPRRIDAALRAAGIDAGQRAAMEEQIDENKWKSALSFARRRRIGPYAAEPADITARRRAIAAMIRAGHEVDIARRISETPPGIVPSEDE